MSVIEGEGTHLILYGTYTMPDGSSIAAHIARPDLGGTYPTVIVAHSARGLSSHVKALCRHLARHGFAVIAPDLYRGSDTGFDDLDAAVAAFDDAGRGPSRALEAALDSARMPGTAWASTEQIGLLALGHGGIPAVSLAAAEPELDALVLAYVPVDGLAEALAGSDVPILGLYGGEDEVTPPDGARELRSALGRGEFRIYAGVGHEFLDDGGGTYDHGAADDALDRVREFLGAHLGVPTPA
jgi:carboxymethylenebutenolidase